MPYGEIDCKLFEHWIKVGQFATQRKFEEAQR